jgi:hypothetical protein
MFNGPMAKRKRGQSEDGEESDIELPDIEPSAFLAMLSFLYSDDAEIGPETVMTTLYTAKKYSIPALEQRLVIIHTLFPTRALSLDYIYPTITYYWTGLLILDHSYLVANLTNSKIAETKALEPLKS